MTRLFVGLVLILVAAQATAGHRSSSLERVVAFLIASPGRPAD